jgi:hypothetical protein
MTVPKGILVMLAISRYESSSSSRSTNTSRYSSGNSASASITNSAFSFSSSEVFGLVVDRPTLCIPSSKALWSGTPRCCSRS